jgi:hypothetical protein
MKKYLAFLAVSALLFVSLVGCTALLQTATDQGFDLAEKHGVFEPKTVVISKLQKADTQATADSLVTVAFVAQADTAVVVAYRLHRAPLQRLTDTLIAQALRHAQQKLIRKSRH